jgi:radical SAM protein with 4Fe4S-binding SPASM domain
MKAEIKSSVDGSRRRLYEILPLSAPFTIYIEPTRFCNLKCFFCMHSTRGIPGGEMEKAGFRLADMEMGLYEKFLSEIAGFYPEPKRLVFSGLGEPLMNRALPLMIKKARDIGFAGRIDVITNGVLLTPELTDSLIEAGLSRAQISIQGLNGEDYLEHCGVGVDFDRLLENIRYFFEHRKKTEVYVKIIDAQLKDENARGQFYQMFGDICDSIFVEHLIVMEHQMGDHHGRTDFKRNLNNEFIDSGRKMCAALTYQLSVNVDGDVFPCVIPGQPKGFALGNAAVHSLGAIWESAKRNRLILAHLRGDKPKIPYCGHCMAAFCVADETEWLEPYAEELVQRYESRLGAYDIHQTGV